MADSNQEHEASAQVTAIAALVQCKQEDEERIRSIVSQKEAAERKLKKAKEELSTLRASTKVKDADVKEMIKTLKGRHRSEIKSYTDSASEDRKTIKALEDTTNLSNGQNDDELKRLQDEKSEFAKKNSDLVAENSKLVKEKSKLLKDNADINKLLTKFENEKEAIAAERDKIRDQLEAGAATIQTAENLRSKDAEFNNQTAELLKLQAALSEKSRELKKGKDNVDKLEDQLKQVQDTNSKEIEEKNNRVKELEAALSEKLRELKKGKNDVDKLEDQLKQVQDTNSKEIEEKNSRVKELEAALSEKSQECNGLKERSAMLSRVQEKNDVKTRAKQLEPEKVSDTEKLHAEIREAHAKQTTENERYDELTRFAIALRILLHESLYVVKHFAGTIKEEIKLPRNNHARPNVASMMYRFEFLLFVCRKSLNTSRLPEVLRGEDTFRCSGKESADEWQELANPELVRKSDEIIQEWVIKGVGHNLTGMDESAKPWLKGVSIHNNILSLTCRETSI